MLEFTAPFDSMIPAVAAIAEPGPTAGPGIAGDLSEPAAPGRTRAQIRVDAQYRSASATMSITSSFGMPASRSLAKAGAG